MLLATTIWHLHIMALRGYKYAQQSIACCRMDLGGKQFFQVSHSLKQTVSLSPLRTLHAARSWLGFFRCCLTFKTRADVAAGRRTQVSARSCPFNGEGSSHFLQSQPPSSQVPPNCPVCISRRWDWHKQIFQLPIQGLAWFLPCE